MKIKVEMVIELTERDILDLKCQTDDVLGYLEQELKYGDWVQYQVFEVKIKEIIDK